MKMFNWKKPLPLLAAIACFCSLLVTVALLYNVNFRVNVMRIIAKQGYTWAQFNLGGMYARGQGVTEDDVEAAKWYRKAAEQGFAAAQRKLGDMYYKGQGVPQDDEEAVKWYRKAAEQGDEYVLDNLVLMYEKGAGVPKDEVEAYAWYLLAEENGYEASGWYVSSLEKRLTAEQMEKGQARAAEHGTP